MDFEVAVLGGGITGCLAAAMLADAGVRVAVLERAPELMTGASLWNDGKIHLGYTFTGTGSLSTAALMQEGSAVFRPIVEQVVGGPLQDGWLGSSITYLVDAASMVDAEVLWGRAQQVAALVEQTQRRHAGLVCTAGPALRRLDVDDAARQTGQDRIVAAWRTTELHLSPRPIAASIRDGVHGRDIAVLRSDVRSVVPIAGGWRIGAADGAVVTATIVVNCLWQERALIDRQVVGIPESVSIRYKWCLFGRGVPSVQRFSPSTRILGMYGDVATYPDGDAYLSWYPAGLAARSDDGTPPIVGEVDREAIIRGTLAGLGLERSLLRDEEERWTVGGGYVVAHGYGDIDSMASPLHARDRPGARELLEGYVSVDTGKYTLGPMLAARASELVLDRRRRRAAR